MEGLTERIAREKKEKYEASDEYKQLMADKARDARNVALAATSQISDADIAAQKASSAGDTTEQARRWVADVTGSAVDGELGEALKSGVLLCEVVNAIKPGHIKKIAQSKMPFPQRENIKAFTDAARDVFRVPDRDNFETGDLFEQTNMKQVVICILAVGRASGSVAGYSGPTISNEGSAKKAPKRSNSKVMSLGSGLKLNRGGPPPASPGSMEWLRQQKEAKEKAAAEGGGGGAGGGRSIKDRGVGLGIPLGLPPASPAAGGGAAPSASEDAGTPAKLATPTASRASRGKRRASTRRPNRRRKGSAAAADAEPKADATPQAEAAPEQATPKSVRAAPAGALVLPQLDSQPKLKSAEEFVPRREKLKGGAPAGALVLPKLPPKPEPEPEFVVPAGIDAALTMMYETADEEPSDELSLEQLSALVKDGTVSGETRVWTEGMEDWTTFDGASWRFGIGDRSLQHEQADGEPSEELPMARFQTLIDDGSVDGGTRVWSEGMDDWVALAEVAGWLGLSGVTGGGEDEMEAQRTVVYDTDGDGTASDHLTLAELTELLEAGTITDDTMVWSEGMDEWAALSECRDQLFGGGGDSGGRQWETMMYETADDEPSDEIGMDEARRLIDAGTITDSTRVWTEGLDDWTPMSEVKDELVALAVLNPDR